MATLLSCGFTLQELTALRDEGIVGGCCCSCSPSYCGEDLHEAECKGQSEAASCRSQGRSCPWAVPAAPAAEHLDRCSSSPGSAPSGDEESSQ